MTRGPGIGGWLFRLGTFIGVCASLSAFAAAPNSLLLNEANNVSGGSFLDKGRADPAFGRVEGNGQNWFELLVVQGDELPGGGFKNTLDLRGWTIEWSYDKDNLHVQKGAGTIRFTQDPLWAAVPRGSLITISEWQDAWYLVDTPPSYDPWLNGGGLARAGGINGLGNLRGAAFNNPDPQNPTYQKLGATPQNPDPHVLHTDTSWNPAKNGGGYDGDWTLHVYAGERNPDNSFKYFEFDGSVTDSNGTHAIGTDEGGLFAINNDEWRMTIRDKPAQGQNPLDAPIIQGPIGEHLPGSSYGVGTTEISRLEAFNDRFALPTQADYLGATIASYRSGSTSTFGTRNIWDSGDSHQGLLALRDWLRPGDADLDGAVTAADYVLWRKHQGTAGDWRDGDFSGDGIVDGTDFDIWRAHFGETGPGSGSELTQSTVPEPQACVLLAIAMLGRGLTQRRRGRKEGICNSVFDYFCSPRASA